MKTLKRISLLLFLCFVVSVTAMSTVQATDKQVEAKPKVTETTAIIVIGPSELVKLDFSKTIDTFVAANEEFKKKLKDNKMFIGSKPQNKYIKFWKEKNLEPKTVLNKEEMLEFTKYSKYDNLFIIMLEKPDFLLDSKTINLYHENPAITLEILAFLIDKQGIMGSMHMTLAGG